ncbi:MAG: hypothetical protein ACRCZF_13150 [Gemmataceae bacterium]
MTPEAEEAIAEFARDCGPDIWKMRQSCETYLHNYLVKFPVEHELMLAALTLGVPERIVRFGDSDGYDAFLGELAEKFEHAAHTDAEAAKWTVGAWAFSLGKPLGYVKVELENDGKVYAAALDPKKVRLEQNLMTLIVIGGGGIGGICAVLTLPVLFLLVDLTHDGVDYLNSELGVGLAIFLLMMALFDGVVAAFASFVGWYMGRGDRKPWASASAAFGTAFGTSMVLTMLGSLFLRPIFLFASVFTVVYKTSARGGHY